MKRVRTDDAVAKRVHNASLSDLVLTLIPKLVNTSLTAHNEVVLTLSAILDDTSIREIDRAYDGIVNIVAQRGRMHLISVRQYASAYLDARRASNSSIIAGTSGAEGRFAIVEPEDRSAWIKMAVLLIECVDSAAFPTCRRLCEEIVIQIKVNSLLTADVICMMDLPFVTRVRALVAGQALMVLVSIDASIRAG